MRNLILMVLLGAAAVVRAETPEYSLPDLKGETHSLSDYRGKWVVVNYWATWCPPCQEEIPDLIDFYEQNKSKDIVVLGVNTEEISREQLASFAESYLISYPILRSDPIIASPLGPVPGLPTTYIVAPDGEPVARQVGPVTSKQLTDYIERKRKELKKP